MRSLSKSKLLSFRQCPKRLWQEVHGRHLMEKVGTDSAFTAGRSVGELARELFDPQGLGRLVDVGALGVEGATLSWRMVEVKSSSAVKDYQRDDAAIQAYVVRAAGVPLESVAVATVR